MDSKAMVQFVTTGVASWLLVVRYVQIIGSIKNAVEIDFERQSPLSLSRRWISNQKLSEIGSRRGSSL